MNYSELTKAISKETGIPLHVFNIDEEPQHLKHNGMGFYISSFESNVTGINCEYAFIKDETRYWKGLRVNISKQHTELFVEKINNIFTINGMKLIDLANEKPPFKYTDNGFLVLMIVLNSNSGIQLDFALEITRS